MSCSNSQCFVRKVIVFSPHDLTLLVKKKNYKVKFSTTSILKKIKSTKIILEKIIKKTAKKTSGEIL